MTTATKSVAAATVASALGLGVAVFWPAGPRTVTVESSVPCVLQSTTNLAGPWRDATVTVFPADEPVKFFRGVIRSLSVTLAWDASSDYAVAGYRVYVGPASRTYTTNYDAGNTTNFTLAHPVFATNFYAATCYDPYGVESEFSNEATVVTPRPTLTIQ